MKISILVPLYNEEEFVATLLERVIAAPLPTGFDREIIVADDGSTDASVEEVEAVAEKYPGVIRLLRAARNQGKGAALRRAIVEARGEFSIIQDADLEYNPNEYLKLLGPLVDGRADAVFGSRFMSSGERRVLYFWHSLANHLLTGMCNVFADLNLTDMETCYKAFRTSLLKSIPIRSQRFGVEPELTIKVARRQVRIYETPISYHGRTYEEGKKIGLKDAIEAVYVILRYAFTNDIYKDSGPDVLHALSKAPRFNRWMGDTIRPYVGERVLEIGAGIGNLTANLVPRAIYHASDINPHYLDRLETLKQTRPYLQVHYTDASAAETYPAEQFDTVICMNVVEHLANDVEALCNIRRSLDKNGRAIVLVPNGPRLFGSLDKVLGHYRRYTQEQLVQVCQDAGFSVEKVLKFNRFGTPGWWLNGRLLKKETFGFWQIKLLNFLVPFVRPIDRFLPFPHLSWIVILHSNPQASGEFSAESPLGNPLLST